MRFRLIGYRPPENTYELENDYDEYTYGGKSRRELKKRFRITGLVEDHHIIPKQWKSHPVIEKFDYNIWKSSNLMMLPSKAGTVRLNTTKLVHSGGHTPYNNYVKLRLDNVTSEAELNDLVKFLRRNLRGNPDNIDWK